ncbi:MAG TPA: hypothetical protein VI072_17805 [Polyangiaceae bacterium]
MSNLTFKQAAPGAHARRILTALALLLAACVGCEATSYERNPDRGSLVTADVIRQRTKGTVGNVARRVPDIRPFTQGETWSALAGAVAGFLRAFETVPLFPSRIGAEVAPPPDCPPEEVGPDGSCTFNPRAVLLALSDFLEQSLFSDDHLEARERNSATFLLRGASFCDGMQPCSGAPGELCGAPNASCIQSIDAAQVRVKATLVGADGLDVAVLVGPDRAKPVVLELRPTSLAVELDLESGKLALDHLQAVAGNGEAEVGRARGRLRFQFTSPGPDDISFVSSIPEAVQFQLNVPQGPIELAIAARSPAITLRAQGAQGALETLSIAVDNGPIDLSVPYAFLTEGKGSGTLALHLSGQTWRTEAKANQPSLVLTDISWHEPSTLKKDGVAIFALDVNPNSGRKFELSLTPAETPAGILFRVQPELDVSADCNLQAIANEFPDIPVPFQSTRYELALQGPGEASVLPIADSKAVAEAGLKVVSGQLSLHASGHDSLVIPAGQCIRVVETSPKQFAFELNACQ